MVESSNPLQKYISCSQ